MGFLRDALLNWLNIQPSSQQAVSIVETYTYEMSVFRNQMWYRGDPSELDQFYSQVDDNIGHTSFWAAHATHNVRFRKIHTGVPALIVDVLVDIILSDYIGIEIENTEAQKRWDAIAEDNNFLETLKTALRKMMVEGDGAFKLSYNEDISKMPLIEFYSSTRVDYTVERNRLTAITFKTRYPKPHQQTGWYLLKEIYTKEGITYRLEDEKGEEVPLNTIPSLADLEPLENPNEFMLAVPIQMDSNPTFPHRGKSLYDGKDGAFDAFDEVVSQWMDSLRDGRTTRYIPKTLIPQNPNDGKIMKPNSFDNRYIQTGADMSEDGKNQIQVIAGEIPHDALTATYITMLDLCLQGIISPSTLGIDMKKLDNAEAQREKEKMTLYTRNKLISVLENVVPELVTTTLSMDDMLKHQSPPEEGYLVSISFGEYANPSFEAQVETIGKARQMGIMSVERSVEELYGDSLTKDEKAEEVQRLKDELGIVSTEDDGGIEGELPTPPPENDLLVEPEEPEAEVEEV